MNLCLIFAVGGTSLAFALYQAQSEMHGLRRDLDRQSAVLAESLEKSAEPLVAAHSYRELQRLADRFKDHERVAGVAFYDDMDRPLAITPNLSERLPQLPEVVDHAARLEQYGTVVRRWKGAALPDELIDMVTLCGPRDVVRDRIAAFREAEKGLMVFPMAFTREDRIAQLRAVAELAA